MPSKTLSKAGMPEAWTPEPGTVPVSVVRDEPNEPGLDGGDEPRLVGHARGPHLFKPADDLLHSHRFNCSRSRGPRHAPADGRIAGGGKHHKISLAEHETLPGISDVTAPHPSCDEAGGVGSP